MNRTRWSPGSLLLGLLFSGLATLPTGGSAQGAAQIVLERPTRPDRAIRHNGKSVGRRIPLPQNTLAEFAVHDVNTILYEVKIKGEVIPQPGVNFDDFLAFTKGKGKKLEDMIPSQPKGAPPVGAGQEPPLVTAYYAAVNLFQAAIVDFAKGADIRAALTDVTLGTETTALPARSTLHPTPMKEYVDTESAKALTAAGLAAPIMATKSQQFDVVSARFSDVREAMNTVRSSATVTQPWKDQVKGHFDAIVTPVRQNSETVREDFRQADALYSALRKASFDVVYTDSLDVGESNDVRFTVTISRRESTTANVGQSVALKVPEPIVITASAAGGWRTDSSVGFVFSRLTEPSYDIRPNGQGRNVIVRVGSEDKFNPQFGAMIHRHGPIELLQGLDGGLSFGLALDGNNRLQYGLGASVFLGNSRRIVLTLGVAGGQVSKLDKLREGDEVTGNTIPRRSVNEFRPFFAVTWNLN